MDKQSNRLNPLKNSSSRYTQGGKTDQYSNRLGWWERAAMERHHTDITYTVTAETQFRPDLIAYDIYGKAKYQWLVLQYNNIVDINEELIVGSVITLPSPSRAQQSILNRPLGGNRVVSTAERS